MADEAPKLIQISKGGPGVKKDGFNLISEKVVKVDVGNFNKNLDVAEAYGNPIKKGIPAAVVLSPENKVLYATRLGELADARNMSETGIYDFFKRVTQAAKGQR